MSDTSSTTRLASGSESDAALIIGRAVASTVVTMAEMESIGKDILAANGIKDVDPLAWDSE